MTKVAEILVRQLRLASPETYRFRRAVVHELYRDFSGWFAEIDPDFLPLRFYALVFGEYPEDLYG